MKLVIQRVKKAKVSVSGNVVGEIGEGLFVLIGVGEGDSYKDAEVSAEKLVKLRIMSDSEDKMNLSIKDSNGSILAVSQFTLYADTTAGNRPSFTRAAKPESAKEIYEHFVNCLSEKDLKVETGEFGSYMEIEAALDGPVTILV